MKFLVSFCYAAGFTTLAFIWSVLANYYPVIALLVVLFGVLWVFVHTVLLP